MAYPDDITVLLRQARAGDRVSEGTVYELVYRQLRSRAHKMLHGDRLAPTLSSSTLVHESFEKLFRSNSFIEFHDRTHFYLVAARAMRQVIIENARMRAALRRGGDLVQMPLEIVEAASSSSLSIDQLIAVGEACERLAAEA